MDGGGGVCVRRGACSPCKVGSEVTYSCLAHPTRARIHWGQRGIYVSTRLFVSFIALD